MQRTVKHKQTILDMSIQEFGTVEASFDLSVANECPITAILPTGTSLVVEPSKKMNRGVVNYYKSNKVLPATNSESNIGSSTIGHFTIGSYTIKK